MPLVFLVALVCLQVCSRRDSLSISTQELMGKGSPVSRRRILRTFLALLEQVLCLMRLIRSKKIHRHSSLLERTANTSQITSRMPA